MTVFAAYDLLGRQIAKGNGDKELHYCLQTLGEHRHLPVVNLTLRDKVEVQHAKENEVLLEVL